jgi:hypothetical protein
MLWNPVSLGTPKPLSVPPSGIPRSPNKQIYTYHIYIYRERDIYIYIEIDIDIDINRYISHSIDKSINYASLLYVNFNQTCPKIIENPLPNAAGLQGTDAAQGSSPAD